MDKEKRKAMQAQYTDRMVEYLPTLRSAAKVTQNQLAKKTGLARSTVVAIESRNRKLQWYVYLAMVLVFMQNDDSLKLLESFELFNSDFLQEII
ncbi:MAG: helix-turn-helix transcriptional regulator [Defluviitaleaceae bacterium]|nr:helix-turn-helix transcriptional regulator [Defluviitaleaceae bacterium]